MKLPTHLNTTLSASDVTTLILQKITEYFILKFDYSRLIIQGIKLINREHFCYNSKNY